MRRACAPPLCRPQACERQVAHESHVSALNEQLQRLQADLDRGRAEFQTLSETRDTLVQASRRVGQGSVASALVRAACGHACWQCAPVARPCRGVW